ncbi:MAG: DUF4266 domain-containing protein [Polyangiaceae bacterium]
MKSIALAICTLLSLVFCSSCVTVRPQERAVLADPIMRFDAENAASAQLRHAIENREGSYGGENVTGGGCGCN